MKNKWNFWILGESNVRYHSTNYSTFDISCILRHLIGVVENLHRERVRVVAHTELARNRRRKISAVVKHQLIDYSLHFGLSFNVHWNVTVLEYLLTTLKQFYRPLRGPEQSVQCVCLSGCMSGELTFERKTSDLDICHFKLSRWSLKVGQSSRSQKKNIANKISITSNGFLVFFHSIHFVIVNICRRYDESSTNKRLNYSRCNASQCDGCPFLPCAWRHLANAIKTVPWVQLVKKDMTPLAKVRQLCLLSEKRGSPKMRPVY